MRVPSAAMAEKSGAGPEGTSRDCQTWMPSSTAMKRVISMSQRRRFRSAGLDEVEGI